MKTQDEILFEQLKKEVSKTFLQDFPSSNPDISQWKGLDIIYFQEHLRQKVKGNVSEKWFYTYFKSAFEKLPRIDMLNLLAQYAGYRRGWTEFVEVNNENVKNLKPEIIEKYEDGEKEGNLIPDIHSKRSINKKRILLISSLVVSVLFIVFLIYRYLESRNTYEFCFYDADRGSIINSELKITINKIGFSPEYYKISGGCFTYKSSIDTLKMTVESPIYKKEFFVVGLKSIRDNREDNHRNFLLRPDDYAVMLYYYSTNLNNVSENKKAHLIKQRKEELNKLIADNALIYQVYDSELFGVEVLDKKKYIDFMTTPTTSLKNYVLIESKVNKYNKINLIKFKIERNEN